MTTHSKSTCALLGLTLLGSLGSAARPPAPIVDTAQSRCFDEYKSIPPASEGRRFYGQDAQFLGLQANYTDNQNGTISDQVTGLMWSKACSPKKVTMQEAQAIADSMTLGGHDDWRLPTIKELYSLIDFRGVTGMAGREMSQIPKTAIPYINTDYFDFLYGKIDEGERFIDAQWLSQTLT